MQQEGGVRDRKDAGGDGPVPDRGAPAALGGDRDQVVGREEPCDLLRRDRQAERDRRPRTVTPDPRDHERDRVEQVGAPADGERGEAGRAEETGEEEGTESGGRAPQDERHRREKTGDIEIVRVDPRRHEGDEQQERQRGVARPPDEFIVRAVAARTQRPGRVHLVVARVDHVVREESAPKRRRTIGSDPQAAVAGEEIEIAIGVAALDHEAGGALVERDRVVVVRRPVVGVLPRHVDEPGEADEGHDADERPHRAEGPDPAGRRRRVATTRPAEGEGEHDDRRGDGEHDGGRATSPGMLEDDAVDDSREVERGASDRDRRETDERPHALAERGLYHAAADHLVAVVEDGRLARRHERGRGELERGVVAAHAHRRGKRGAAVTEDRRRRELV